MPTPSGGDGGAAALEKARQQKIDSGMLSIDNAFRGFDNNFFDKRAQDYTNFALPKAQSQFDTTRKSLAYSLARNGLSNSSAAVNENQALQNTRNEKIGDIVNEGQNQANTLRSNVATQKSNVVNQLVSSANPSLAHESALSATAGLNAPSAFAPIGQLFSDFSEQYLNNQTAKAYSNSSGGGSVWGNLFGAK